MYGQPVRMLAEVWRALWRKLQWRLFAAFVVILIAAVSVQTITADFFAWRSIEGYVETHRTSALNMPGALASQAIWAFTISLFLATCVSVVAAAAASLFVSHRIVEPIQRMMEISRRIAEGRYHDRVPVSDDYEISHLALSLNSFNGQYGISDAHLLMAASVVCMLPCVILFFAAQKYFVESVAMTGLKA